MSKKFDWAAIQEKTESLGSSEEKVRYLTQTLIEMEHDPDKPQGVKMRHSRAILGTLNKSTAAETWVATYRKCESLREEYQKLLRLSKQYPVTSAQEAAADESTTAGRVMAVYYLLLAAGADYGLNKSRMG